MDGFTYPTPSVTQVRHESSSHSVRSATQSYQALIPDPTDIAQSVSSQYLSKASDFCSPTFTTIASSTPSRTPSPVVAKPAARKDYGTIVVSVIIAIAAICGLGVWLYFKGWPKHQKRQAHLAAVNKANADQQQWLDWVKSTVARPERPTLSRTAEVPKPQHLRPDPSAFMDDSTELVSLQRCAASAGAWPSEPLGPQTKRPEHDSMRSFETYRAALAWVHRSDDRYSVPCSGWKKPRFPAYGLRLPS